MTKSKAAPRKPASSAEAAVSRNRAPDGMDTASWQIALRRQFGAKQKFELENLGRQQFLSDFRVRNPASGGDYRVTIRGEALGMNRCSCGDFQTNELGTCKHIEFVLARLLKQSGAKTMLKPGFKPSYSELWIRYGARRELMLRLSDSAPAPLAQALLAKVEPNENLRDRVFRVRSLAPVELDAFVGLASQHRHQLLISDDVHRLVQREHSDAGLRRVLDSSYGQAAEDPALVRLLALPLLPYQRLGVWFAAYCGRTLIADDMGLGKTVQAIGALRLWQRHAALTRALIVCPTSLKHQWAQELKRFAGTDAQVIEGPPAERARQFANPIGCKIISYDSLYRDEKVAQAWAPEALIVDEAQRIKNWDTRAARCLKRLDSRFAIVLTGTPLENRLEELLSVVQLVDRHRLGPTWRFLHHHQLRDERGRVIGYQRLDEIAKTLEPIMLRRRKREVLTELPPRRDFNLMLPLTDEQQAVHDEYKDLVGRLVHKWRRHGFLSDGDLKRLRAWLSAMRRVCNSTYLLDPQTNHSVKIPELLSWLEDQLSDPDNKVVVFSSWLGTHELLGEGLTAIGIDYVWFHGGVPSGKRNPLVQRFKTDPKCRVFLSTDAGGVGLNLQDAAALIVNVDLPWNPAVLEQRIGRVHRMGQQHPVEVLNLISRNSIEERILALIGFKRAVFEGVLDDGATEVSLDSGQLRQFMESVETVTTDVTPLPTEQAAASHVPLPADCAAPNTGADQPLSPDLPAEASVHTPSGDEPVTPINTQDGQPPDPISTDPATKVTPTPSDPFASAAVALAPLLQAAGSWFSQIAASLADPNSAPVVVTDPKSGQPKLQLPLPDPALLRQLADLSEALGRLKSG